MHLISESLGREFHREKLEQAEHDRLIRRLRRARAVQSRPAFNSTFAQIIRNAFRLQPAG